MSTWVLEHGMVPLLVPDIFLPVDFDFFIQTSSLRILYDCPQLSSAKRENVKDVKAFVSLSINSVVTYKSNLFHTQW